MISLEGAISELTKPEKQKQENNIIKNMSEAIKTRKTKFKV